MHIKTFAQAIKQPNLKDYIILQLYKKEIGSYLVYYDTSTNEKRTKRFDNRKQYTKFFSNFLQHQFGLPDFLSYEKSSLVYSEEIVYLAKQHNALNIFDRDFDLIFTFCETDELERTRIYNTQLDTYRKLKWHNTNVGPKEQPSPRKASGSQ